ncbi:squalene synthase HpnC [Actinoallomurus sp. NPDC050550]|uniref:squalene synthase HpnC n=1 Tax=Actinoallomurus sp. NPDC050550 TaxID=3154937 RepID=UPI003408FAAA
MSSAEGVIYKARRENFPVASRLLPRGYRRHLMAIYGFARFIDDVGDEAPPADCPRLLDIVDNDLGRLYAGRTPKVPAVGALERTVTAFGIPAEPFRQLVRAGRRDQAVTRYESFEELLAYCELSANPVGHIVLHVFGAADARRCALSDQVCSALQVIEHCQDVGEDYARGRVYLPGADLRRFGCTDDDFVRTATSDGLRRVVALQTTRATGLLDAGTSLVAMLRGPARVAVAGYIAGGRATINALQAADHDVLGQAVRPRRSRLLTTWLRVLATGR